MDIKEKIRQFIMEELKELSENGNVEYLRDDTPLIDNGFIDSMMILSLLAFLEENYGLLLSKDELKPESFATIQTIHDLIIQKATGS
jgi:acyl carrier protein